ncbi:MAG: aldolase/citrate lyase family protein [Anaerolineae bacterium]|jgi:2-dehydro-3-deoxyglucarate aldolase/4-hydroxy-2-oxoheptanedioate aldolase
MPNLKERLRAGELLIGSLVTMPSLDVAEIMARVGFDYLWIETEHAPMDFVHAQSVIQAVGGRCPCLVRIPDKQEVWVKKALDIGCEGIIVPQIRSAAEARQIIEWSLYPPDGRRSVGVSRAHSYGMAFRDTIDTVNDELVIVLQAEHADAVRDIASLVQVPGIAAVLVGPFDLSGSLGVLGEVDHPRVLEAIETVRRHCQVAGVPLGIFAPDVAMAKEYIGQGFRLIALSMDAFFLWQSAMAAVTEARGGSPQGGS